MYPCVSVGAFVYGVSFCVTATITSMMMPTVHGLFINFKWDIQKFVTISVLIKMFTT